MTPARLLYVAAGQPDPRKPQHHHAKGVTCFVCGLPWAGTACRVQDVCASTYTDEDIARARWSDWVCVPCAWAMTGRPPDTLRNWSIVYRSDRQLAQTNDKAPSFPPACVTTRADSRPIVETLLDPPADGSPWFVAVAESGQIHTTPFAPLNAGAGAWGARHPSDTAIARQGVQDVRQGVPPTPPCRRAHGARRQVVGAKVLQSPMQQPPREVTMPRPRRVNRGPLAQMTSAEIAALADATGCTVGTVDTWRRGTRPASRLSDVIADTLHAGDPERWPDATALARELREMEAGR